MLFEGPKALPRTESDVGHIPGWEFANKSCDRQRKIRIGLGVLTAWIFRLAIFPSPVPSTPFGKVWTMAHNVTHWLGVDFQLSKAELP